MEELTACLFKAHSSTLCRDPSPLTSFELIALPCWKPFHACTLNKTQTPYLKVPFDLTPPACTSDLISHYNAVPASLWLLSVSHQAHTTLDAHTGCLFHLEWSCPREPMPSSHFHSSLSSNVHPQKGLRWLLSIKLSYNKKKCKKEIFHFLLCHDLKWLYLFSLSIGCLPPTDYNLHESRGFSCFTSMSPMF